MEEKLSVNRTENKYLISYNTAILLQSKLDKVLKRDEYSVDGNYMVRSLYFDSINNIDYYTKMAGIEERKKIRLRIYNTDAKQCKLEIKQKIGDLQRKVSVVISRNDAEKLIKGNYNVLSNYFSTAKEAIDIYNVMTIGCYRPVVLIEYDRLAYTCQICNTRITFDTRLQSSESNYDLLSEKIMYTPILNDNVILEVKYNGHLVGGISKLLQPYELNKTSISKYCMGRKQFHNFN